MVPIVPSLHKEMHRMWQAYNGWTFAFTDYMQQNATRYIDTPEMTQLLSIVDPAYYYDRLARLPKFVVLSSDDEFMMMDWSNIWYDDMLGEKHLFIVPDAEHSLITGIPEVATSLAVFASSIAHGKTSRPYFNYTYDNATGEVTVTIPDEFPADFVILHTGHTTQTIRRDFRWVRLANNQSGACKLPDIPLPKPIFGGNCQQPIFCNNVTLSTTTPGVYRYTPPSPPKNWMGYYIEMKFPSDTGMVDHFQFTTPGFVWPNTLPFADCANEACEGYLV
jgi:PhoPQ-activated pathogenicity-related protein